VAGAPEGEDTLPHNPLMRLLEPINKQGPLRVFLPRLRKDGVRLIEASTHTPFPLPINLSTIPKIPNHAFK